jgi:hypothetical protein
MKNINLSPNNKFLHYGYNSQASIGKGSYVYGKPSGMSLHLKNIF